MKTFYNEFDPFAANWLRQLQLGGHITDGHVEEKSISDLKTKDLQGYGRQHYFAGIGGWDFALKLAGWPQDAPIWTGSCPCQPFSDAGSRKGVADPRHLFPVWSKLIQKCRPPVIFGEQVASNAGRDWLVGVRATLEGLGYEVGGADLCAAGFNAPHIRQRLYWMAHTHGGRRQQRQPGVGAISKPDKSGALVRMVQPQRLRTVRTFGDGLSSKGAVQGTRRADAGLDEAWHAGAHGRLDHGKRLGWYAQRDHHREDDGLKPHSNGQVRRLGNTGGASLAPSEPQILRSKGRGKEGRATQQPSGSPWADYRLIQCSDGKTRRISPSIFPLADGVSRRVGKLRGAGNAIVPIQAATFVRVCMEYLGMVP